MGDERHGKSNERVTPRTLPDRGGETGFWEWDTQTGEVLCDEVAERLLGYEPGGFPGGYDAVAERVHPEDLPLVEKSRFGAENGYRTVEFRVVVGGETRRRVESRATAFGGDGGGEAEPTRLVGSFKKTAQNECGSGVATTEGDRAELERYRTLVENTTEAILHLDGEGRVLYENISPESVFRYGPDLSVGDDAFEYIYPDDREQVAEDFEDLLTGERETAKAEFRIGGEEGYAWAEAVAKNLTDTELRGAVVSIRDVTRRKERERELERYEAFVENSSDVIAHLDEDGTMLYESTGTERVFGHEPEINLGENVFEYVHPDDAERVMEKFVSVLRDPESRVGEAELRLENADGEYVWVEAAGTDQRDTEVGGIIVSLRDVSERKKRERDILDQQRVLETVLSNVPVVVFELDDEGIFTRSEGMALEYLGLEDGDAVGESVFEMYDDSPGVREDVERALGGERVRSTQEIEGRVLETWYEPLEQDGSVEGTVGLAYDVTERERRKRELERYEKYTKNSTDVIMHLDEDGKLLYESPGGERIYGREPGEQDGDYAFDYVHPEDRERIVEEFADLVNDPEEEMKVLEVRMLTSENPKEDEIGEDEYIWVEAAGADQTDTDVGGVVASVRDISERKQRERALETYKRELERSNEHLEQFAYVASHDLKEPLRMVSGHLDLLADEYEDELDDEADEYIEFAVDGAERMREMIDALLEYSRAGARDSEFEEVDTEEVLGTVLRDLELLLDGNDVKVKHEDLPTIEADAEQLAQVFQNLIKNAVEHGSATETDAGGRGEEVHDDAFEVRVGAEKKDDAYEFYVADEGVGIPRSQQKDIFGIFERLGTDSGDGAGIGLAVCSRIVKNHGGDIRVESAEGEGTTFRFTIPMDPYSTV